MPSVAGPGRQVSCLPTLSLEAGDEWDCRSQGQLAAHCHLALRFRPPGASAVRLCRQQRRANVLQRLRAVERDPLLSRARRTWRPEERNLCRPATEPSRGDPAASRNAEEPVEEPDVDRGAGRHLGGGTGPAPVRPGRHLCPLSPRRPEIQEQGRAIVKLLSCSFPFHFLRFPSF